ncbi:MAG: hypothetical protein KF819_09670 [Labilithrix sp.]|nr:hypothetical protein [Labilithrix sp.]
MKLSLRAACLLAIPGALGIVAACSDASPEAAPDPAADGGALPVVDASAPETDADADAEAPRECSKDGFCPTALPPGQTLRGVWGDGTGIVWSVTDEGNVLRWDGTTWKIHASGLGPLGAIWGSGPTDVWIGGEEGLRRGTGGASATLTFAKIAPPGGVAVSIRSIWGSGPDDVWAAGGTVEPQPAGRVLHYAARDGGPSLAIDAVSTQPTPTAFASVWGSTATGVWVAGARLLEGEDFFEEIAVFRRAAGASAFAEVTLPPDPEEAPVFGVLAVMGGAAISGDDVLVLGRSSSAVPGIWRGTTTNGGATFTFSYTKAGRNDAPPINALCGVSSKNAWAVGDYGRVHRWDGDAWTQAAVTRTKFPLTDPLYAVWAAGPEDVWVVGKQIALRRDPSKKQP